MHFPLQRRADKSWGAFLQKRYFELNVFISTSKFLLHTYMEMRKQQGGSNQESSRSLLKLIEALR